ncbi:MAG TPA: Asp-tRNA(Asn)/Glu-tRNA(Gln) amidotransferase subunit GatC [Nitrososphaeraceae archaeon]|jgi:aspartyl-tRNA(Asn)/glutamyl-tRNA(Gln) amidotransferase subunit C|nr:Asp-tRNA(Asn)/Glu-tRNA(Gln) amidotransferase subunit GatC [Nitrososphaeraceae archaeon]
MEHFDMVSMEEIRHLGLLSKLELTDQELRKYESQIEEIIRYLNILDRLSLDEIEPVQSTIKFSELRKDYVETFQGDALKNVKHRRDAFIKGPRMS